MTGIRAFIAFELSEEVRNNLRETVEKLRKGVQFTGAKPSWVKVDNMHLTLKFLGNIEEHLIDRIEETMKRAVEGFSPFETGIKNLGAFPNERAPKVLWIGVKQGKEAVITIQSRLDEELEKIGFEKEKRPFHPHLTIARIKSFKGTREMMNVVKIHSGENAGVCSVARMILFKSELHPEGAIYTKVREIAL